MTGRSRSRWRTSSTRGSRTASWGGSLVVETLADRRYRFPSRGDLGPVREFIDAAASVWARAERHLETVSDALDRMEQSFESGNPGVVLAAVDDARETLADACEAAASLDSAATSVESKAAVHRDRLARLERKAYAEQAEQARERGHEHWDDGAYEAAFDCFEQADESYAAARSIDAPEPDDDLIERRREAIAEDCDRLAAAPLEQAEAAVETARTADDLETAVEWWERALDRYETLRSLDWGCEERRFAGDREAVRERLATVAERLVEARCERARREIALLGDAPPKAAVAAEQRASDALDAAQELARERVPDGLDTVERLRNRLDDHRPVATEDASDIPPITSRETVPIPGDEDGQRPDDETAAADADSAEGDADQDDGDPEPDVEPAATDSEWVFTDDGTDDEWISARRADESDDRDAGPEPDVSSVGPAAFRSVVASCFEAAGWAAEESADAPGSAQLRVTTPGPLSVTAAVRAVPAEAAVDIEAADVEAFAAAVEGDAAVDHAVVVAGARLPDDTRTRVRDGPVRLVDPETLAAAVDRHGIDLPTDEATAD